MRTIQKTKYYSFKVGSLAKGCQLCVKGLKEVVFVTGLCARKCYFCPIANNKKNKDVIFSNEMPVNKLNDIVKEAKLCNSKGAGLTGGDPLIKIDRTLKIIKLLKKEFGKTFHIHLYAPLNFVSKNILKKLEKAGLDEIRFHPELDNEDLWYKIKYNTKMKKGVEIPVIPGKLKQIKNLIKFINNHVDFVNLNELELSDTNACKLYDKGYVAKNKVSYGVKGSDALAKKVLKFILLNTKLNAHYCTVKLKDKVQLLNRLKLRAKNVKRPYDYLTKDYTLLRGVIKANKQKLLKVKKHLIKKYKIPSDLIEYDELKKRLLVSPDIVFRLKKDLKSFNLTLEVVEELPTYDQFEVQSFSV